MLTSLTDMQLVELLAIRRNTLETRQRLWGSSTLRSDRAVISEASDSLYEVDQEIRRRGLQVPA